MMAAWIGGVPVRMHTVAGLPLMEATGVKRRLLMFTERVTYACATGVYPNSKGLMEFIQSKFKIQDSKFRVIGQGSSNGIDVAYFSRTPDLLQVAKDIRTRLLIPDEAIVFSFVGRIVKDKGIVELINSLKRISAVQPAYLLLVGPFEEELDPLPAEVMKFIEQSPLIMKAGFQNDVRPWLLASDVFVFPSYREGFPNVVMQAACLEVPAIVSDINGCNELIQDKVSGWIVPAKDQSALYEAMLTLATRQDLRISYAQQARAFVSTHFNQQFIWNELLNEYQMEMGKGKG
jgi:glycosyltransferase involved in cell wall biosynthesis